jgi:cell division transport system ATP-binding protein
VTHDKQMVDMMNKRVIEIVNGHVVRDEQRGGYSDED